MNGVNQRSGRPAPRLRAVRLAAGFLATAGCALAVAACGSSSSSTGSSSASGGSGAPIKLPAVEMLTGPVSFYGQLTMHGAELAVDNINASGGATVGGQKHKIELVKEDNASDNTQTVNLLRKYCSDGGVGLLIAPTYKPNSDVGGPVSNQCGLPTLTGAAIVPTVNPRGYLFTDTTVANDQIDETLAFAVKETHAKRVAQITDTSDAALTSYRDENVKYLKGAGQGLGATDVADISTKAGAGNYSPQITALAAAHPDLILVNLVTADAARFMQQARGRGVKAPFAATWGNLNDPSIYSLSHGAANGMIASAPVQPSTAAGQSAALKKFLGDYKTKFGKDADPLAIYTYDAVYLAANAMQRANTLTDRDKIKATLAGTKRFCNVLCYTNAGGGVLKTASIYFTHLTSRGHVLAGHTTIG